MHDERSMFEFETHRPDCYSPPSSLQCSLLCLGHSAVLFHASRRARSLPDVMDRGNSLCEHVLLKDRG